MRRLPLVRPSRPTTALWRREAGAWGRWEPQILHALSPIVAPLLQALDLRAGQRVLDVGCGIGEPSLSIAQWIGPRGSVTGLDVSREMLKVARRRARALGLSNVRFIRGDVERFTNRGPRFHRVTSRYGIMFAADPARALANLRAALVPGGRLAVAVWGPPESHAYFALSARLARPYLAGPPLDPRAGPHPMRFGRRGTLERILRATGFRDVRTVGVATPFVFASPRDFARGIVETSSVLRTACERLPRAERERLVRRAERAARTYVDGPVVRVPAFAWVISARR